MKPKEIGPHEGIELDLMLENKKPLAFFSGLGDEIKLFPIDAFDNLVKQNRLVSKKYFFKKNVYGKELDEFLIYYALPNETHRIDKLNKIMLDLRENPRFDKDIEQEIGLLLGYSKHEISVYIKWATEKA
ncbi:MAG: hypothetical protein AB7U85_02640 [Alphaproteobacteria bacterium]